MNEKIEIARSTKAFEFRLTVFSISFFSLASFVTIMIFNLSRTLNLNEVIDLLLAGILICGLYLLFSMALWYQWVGIKYYLTKHALIVKHRVGGIFPSYTEEIYTLNTIRSAKIAQSGFAQKKDYGDITIFISPNDKEVILKDIVSPAELSGSISSRIGITTYRQH